MEFSEKLKSLRTDRGISQAALAEKIHISRSAVAKWENGLGLPSAESMKFLEEYFGVTAKELISDQENQRTLVEKNRTIASQGRLIVLLICFVGAILIFLGLMGREELSLDLELGALGLILCVLGAYNIRGNIASIHWYNRRKVKKEDQGAYCRLVGSGTMLIGLCMTAASLLPALAGAVLNLGGVVMGLGLIVYAQIKYNRGIF